MTDDGGSGWAWPDYRAIYSYAWDLLDEGVDAMLGHIGDTGANTITLATSYHAGRFMRPHGRQGRVKELVDGAVYFRPDMAEYGAIKPLPHPMLDDFDPFAEIEAHDSLQSVAWIVCLHNSALGARHPEFTVRNAFGDHYSFSLDPAASEVQDYIVTLCTDAAQSTNIVGMVLETPGYLPFQHGLHHEFQLMPLNPWVDRLLALSFSDAAMAGAEAAGIDAERLRKLVVSWVDAYLSSDIAIDPAMALEWFMGDILGEPDMAAFLRWRCKIVTDLVAAVRASVPKTVWVGVIPTVQRPTAATWLEGSDLAGQAAAADLVEVPAYQPKVGEVAADLFDVRRRIGDQARMHAILRPDVPDLRTAGEVEAAAVAARDAGASGLSFYNYGHLRRPALARAAAGFRAFA